ncbi:MAG: 23S rRNA (guanosine(2251)-2'-O)-methyltransferase RlmB [Muribaculaceae bacterium]|nr:23S rRNA (guanosine(2251)-2'-O)-methyltransferase RlmB [Muribaculaceae bacterium]
MITKDEYIFGIRAVIEAIESGKDIDKVLIKKDLKSELAAELFAKMKEYSIVGQRVPVDRINRITKKNHQGVVAILSAITFASLDNVVPELYEKGETPLVVILDGITDVRNFGAIARTCECAGVNAIVISERNSAGVNGDAVKTSAGALLHIPVCREKSTLNAVKYLKDSGFQIVGATEKGAVNYTKIDYSVPTAIVMGAEDVGISVDILKICDSYAAIPQFGHISSLNVSVAAGILIYEAVRQRIANNN